VVTRRHAACELCLGSKGEQPEDNS
jgi:hypothetical protein